MEEDRKQLGAREWLRLLREFETYRPDPALSGFDAADFAASVVSPAPAFVEAFLERKRAEALTREEKVRLLYGFLLQKRYEEKLNLLHFAFYVFDEKTCLPEKVIDQTPFPHEDGVPAFKYFGDPALILDPAGS